MKYLALAWMIGCVGYLLFKPMAEGKPKAAPSVEFTCGETAWSIRRCESADAICYVSYNNGISCIPKVGGAVEEDNQDNVNVFRGYE